jgi:hypothetical protein
VTDDHESRDDEVIGRAVRASLLAVFAIAIATAAVVLVTRQSPTPVDDTVTAGPPASPSGVAGEPPTTSFTDITRDAGIAFARISGAEGQKLLPETMGGGVAFLDFDNDGDEDLLFVNSREWPWANAAKVTARRADSSLSLYRNDGHGRFTDVTREAGMQASLYGMGVAAGDYDNDGWTDVFVTAVGPSHLFRNVGGHFTDVTVKAGVGGAADAWSTCAAWIDADNDGDLDIFVCHYVRWSRTIDLAQDFRLTGIGRAYGPPRTFEGAFPTLYRNDGNGRFTDVSAASGVQVKNASTGVPMAKSLGVAPVDLDADGWIDLVVANDTVPNLVFHNQRNGTFREVGAATGIAFDSYGSARSAMGIDAADFRNDGSMGIAIGNFANEMTALYVSQGDGLQYADEAIQAGIGPVSRRSLTFGVLFVDYDLDGYLDLLTANGHIEEDINKVQISQQYSQPPQLFWNAGPSARTTFVPVTLPPDSDLGRPMVARGSAFADIDGDADLDLVLTSVTGPPRLLRNDLRLDHHWMRFRLVGTRSNRDGIGAAIEMVVDGQTVRRTVMPTRGYLSQSELTVTVGLGKRARAESVKVRWPGGGVQEVTEASIDRVTRVVQR